MLTEKFVRDGKVALLISPGFGAGWSSWDDNSDRDILRDPRLVEAFEQGGAEAVIAKAEELWPDDPPYAGGADDLRIVWVTEGTPFYLYEYDGDECIVTDFQTA